MRIRIVQPLSGVIDGLPLSSLMPGLVYDLTNDRAAQLIELHAAEPVPGNDSATIVTLEDVSWRTGGVHVEQRDTAHDRPPRHHRPSKRRR